MVRGILRKKRQVRVVLLLLCILLIFFWWIPLPDPLFDTPYVTTIRSDKGILLSAAIADDQQWRFPPGDSIPRKFETALRLYEDEYFYYHPGVNPVSLFRAIRQNLKAGKIVSGGSTLSMQTVRMAYGNRRRSYFQKLKEVGAALKLEMLCRKSTILKAYAAHAPFGGNIVGLDAASWRFFGRPAHQLSWAETATLAILPNNPSAIFPGKNQEVLLQKRNRLLDKIHDRGLISSDDLTLAKAEALPTKVRPLPNHAYHLLRRGIADGMKGQEIESTIDARLQVEVTREVNAYSRSMAHNEIHNAAAVVLDISTGNTLAYVGNTLNAGEHGQHVDIVTAQRSPGSLLKPFLYAMAMDDGLITPTQLLPDIPIFYNGFAPKNFDKEYRGAVPADQALISSLNVPFVHLLLEYGYEKFHHRLQEIGFQSFKRPAGHYGLSLILGGGETSLWEITGVYASMARALGNYPNRPLNQGYSDDDYHPNIYLKGKSNPDQVMKHRDGFVRVPAIYEAFRAMLQVRRPDSERGWEFFQSAQAIAWKTGTSYGFRDGWAIGLSDQHLIGVWIGNADGEGRPGLTGVRAAAPLLFQLFDVVGGEMRLSQPFGRTRKICKHSGLIATSACEATLNRQLPQYMVAGHDCTYHRTLHLDAAENFQVNSSCYEISRMKPTNWFVLPAVQAWYYQKFHPNYRNIPPYAKGCSSADSKILFDVIYPGQFTRVHIPVEQDGGKGQAVFEAAHDNRDAVVFWHVDEQYMGYTKGTHQKGIQMEKGSHVLTLIDDAGNEIRRRFEVVND